MTLEETPGRIEPCLLDEVQPGILDLVTSLASASQALGSRLHPRSAASLADLVRVMNCYYSNLIEGHNTTPREIVREFFRWQPSLRKHQAMNCAADGF